MGVCSKHMRAQVRSVFISYAYVHVDTSLPACLCMQASTPCAHAGNGGFVWVCAASTCARRCILCLHAYEHMHVYTSLHACSCRQASTPRAHTCTGVFAWVCASSTCACRCILCLHA